MTFASVALKEEDEGGGTHFLSRHGSQKIKRRSGEERKKKEAFSHPEKKNEIFDLTSAKNVQVFCRFDSFFLVLMPLHVTR